MPKMTVLEMTQRLLSKMSSDQVNAIGDTLEAEQVVHIIQDCYEDLVQEMDLSFKGKLTKLESATDVDHPVLLRMPDYFAQIQWIKYGVHPDDATP